MSSATLTDTEDSKLLMCAAAAGGGDSRLLVHCSMGQTTDAERKDAPHIPSCSSADAD